MANKLQLQVILSALDKVSAPLKRIQGNSIGVAQELKETRQRLKELNTQQKDVSAWRAQNAVAGNTAKALGKAQERVKQLSREISAAGTPTRQMSAEMQKAIGTASALKQKHNEQKTALQGLRNKLTAAGISTRDLAQGERELRTKIAATTDTLAKQENRLKRITAQQKRLADAKAQYEKSQSLAGGMAGTGAAGLASGTGILYAGARLMSPQVEAQRQGALVAAQNGSGSPEQYQSIIRNIRAEGVSDDMANVGIALSAVNSTFKAFGEISDAQLTRASSNALNLAAVMGGDVTEHVQTAGILMQNNLAGSIDEAFDLITRGQQSVSRKMGQELPEILHEYSTHFRSMGFSGKEAMNLIVSMAKQGKFALDKTGDAIKEFSIRGSDMSKASVSAYEQIGLNPQKMSDAIARGGDDAQQALQQTARKLLAIKSPADRANAAISLFGTPIEDLAIDQIPAFLRALGGTEDILGDVTGATDKMGKTLRDNLSGDIERLGGSWSDFNSSLMDSRNGPLRDIVKGLTDAIGEVKKWTQANPELTDQIIKTAAGLGLLMAGMGGITLALASILGPFAMVRYGLALFGLKSFSLIGTLWRLGKFALPMVATGLRIIGMAAMANPIIAIIGAIALAATLIYANWDTIGPYFFGLWAEIKQGFSGGIGGILTTLANFSPIGLFYRAFALVMNYLGIEMPAKFTEFGSMLIQGMVNGISNGLASLKNAITNAGGKAIGWFKEKLGIHSPSRVFAELGGHTMAGLKQGLAEGEPNVLKQVAATAEAMAARPPVLPRPVPAPGALDGFLGGLAGGIRKVTDVGAGMLGLPSNAQINGRATLPAAALNTGMLSGGSSLNIDRRPPIAARSGGPTVVQGDTITINLTAPAGADVKSMRAMLNQLLDERERNKAARVRSRLSDSE